MKNEVASTDAVTVFRGLLSTEVSKHVTESDCKRFLRARKWDPHEAATMAENWWKWYNSPIPGGDDTTPATILDSPDPKEFIYQRLMPHSNMGTARSGCPLYWEKTGLISTRFVEISRFLSVDELVMRHIRQQELMVRRLEYISKTHNKMIEKQVCIMDLKNLSYSLDTRALAAFHRTLVIDQAYYPERLQYLFMINAPWFFTATWAMVKNWIDPVTADKIKIVGSDFLATLREHIDDSEIPPELGGRCEGFRWQWPWPSSTGISEAQLGYAPAYYEDERASQEEEVEDWAYSRQGRSAIDTLHIYLQEALVSTTAFHVLFCMVCTCICNTYFFAVWSYMWDCSVGLVLLTVSSQIFLCMMWSKDLLKYLLNLFELNQ